MKIVFFYEQDKTGKFVPCCELEDEHRLNPLTGYLNDPMGGDNYLDFLNNSLMLLKSSGNELDISSNSWGVEILNDNVFIYFLYAQDNEEFQISLPRSLLASVIEHWLDFCKASDLEKKELRILVSL